MTSQEETPAEPERSAFETKIQAELGDWNNYLVYADWLHEAGDLRLEHCYRWMAKKQKYPHHRTRYFNDGYSIINRTESGIPVYATTTTVERKVPDNYQWAWYHGYWTHIARKVGGYKDASIISSTPLWICLHGTNRETQVYPTFRAAVADLAEALQRLLQVASL